MSSTALAEIILFTADVEHSAGFYEGVVGLAPKRQPVNDRAWFRAFNTGRGQRGVPHRGPLLFGEHPQLPVGECWGKVLCAFEVPRDSLDAAATHVRDNGVEASGSAYFYWMRATCHNYFYDPDGNILGFWSPDPDAATKENN